KRMLLEELLHLFGLLRVAETLRAVEKHSDATQSAAGLLVDLVKVRPHEVPRSVLAGRIADQVNQNEQVLASNVRGQSRVKGLLDQSLLRKFGQRIEVSVIHVRRDLFLQLRLVLVVECSVAMAGGNH